MVSTTNPCHSIQWTFFFVCAMSISWSENETPNHSTLSHINVPDLQLLFSNHVDLESFILIHSQSYTETELSVITISYFHIKTSLTSLLWSCIRHFGRILEWFHTRLIIAEFFCLVTEVVSLLWRLLTIHYPPEVGLSPNQI